MSFTKGLYIISLFNFMGVLGVVTLTPIIKSQYSPKTEIEESVAAPSAPVPTITLISPTPSAEKTPVSTERPKSPPAASVTSDPKPIPTADPLAGKCIIFVGGVRYNVTEFRNSHGGGDIFQCGTDMTDIFKNNHPDSYLGKMSGYKI